MPEQPVPVLTDDELRKLPATATGAGFESRRDMAIMRVLMDTGIRPDELAGMTVGAVDRDQDALHVLERAAAPATHRSAPGPPTP